MADVETPSDATTNNEDVSSRNDDVTKCDDVKGSGDVGRSGSKIWDTDSDHCESPEHPTETDALLNSEREKGLDSETGEHMVNGQAVHRHSTDPDQKGKVETDAKPVEPSELTDPLINGSGEDGLDSNVDLYKDIDPGIDICPDIIPDVDTDPGINEGSANSQDDPLLNGTDPLLGQETQGGIESAQNDTSKKRCIIQHQNAIYTANGSSESLGSESLDSRDGERQENGKVPNEADSTDVLFDSLETVDIIEPKAVSFHRLFRYAECGDYLLMLVGTLGAVLAGTALQVNFLIYGRVIDLMLDNSIAENTNMTSTNTTAIPFDREALFAEMMSNIKWFATLGACIIVFAFFEMSFWMWTAERQTRKMRRAVFWAILNKDQGWFDGQHVGELTSMITDDIQSIQNGIGDKFSKMMEWLTTFVVGYIIGFIRGWKLTLVILCVSPLLGLVVALLTQVTRKLTSEEMKCYGAAGTIAEEVLSAIRTVIAYSGEQKETDRYGSNLEAARRMGYKKAVLSGVIQGLVYLIIFCTFALAFWYGTTLVVDGDYTGGEILQIFFGVLQGTTAIGHAVPSFETIAVARSAAAKVFAIIDHVPVIDSSSEHGERPAKCHGSIKFSGVSFSFPTRRSVKVLNGLSFGVHVGQTVALVGSSGSGKSTALQLLQRFYDPDEGEITLDGHPLQDLNLQWLRHRVGVVSQEPILFAKTIAENIRLGHLDATQSEIVQAAKEANAHDFIAALPKKYETLIGERGAQLSGGQKQRIAIARALVRNPKILLLDEATSALDTQSEAIVQKALDKVSEGRTTLVIAHRLSTIKNADVILSLKDGRIIEQGTHLELMRLKGQYHQLVNSQSRVIRETSVDSIDGPLFADEVLKPADRSKSFRRLDSTVSFRRMGAGRTSGRDNKLFRSMSVMSEREEEKEAINLPSPPMRRLLKLNRSEAGRMVVGCIGATFVGAATPTFSIVISEVLGNFATMDPNKMLEDAKILSAIFVAIGLVSGLGCFAQNYFFGTAGENLTLKLRKMTFAAMLKQEIGWFDQQCNQVGALTSRLANDASRIKGAAGQQFGILVQAVANMGSAIVIAFIYGPKLAGVIFCFIPLMFVSGIVQGKLIQDSTKGSMDDLDRCAQVASEAIDNIRTVAALTREQHFEQVYNSKLRAVYWKSKKNAFVFGCFYAFSQSIIYFAYAATFGYGTVLIKQGEIKFYNVFRVFACLIFGSMSLGRALSWMPDYSKAKLAAAKVFNLLDREPLVQSISTGGISPEKCRGDISLLNVTFRYPMRQDVKVLSGFTLTVKPGQTVALVGTSGCGKSTTIQLLERFYDPDQGCVCVDGQNVVALNLPWLRTQIGLVSQEPVLFDLTIRENIAYGDNSREVSLDEIIEAAKEANIHNFIDALPMGYDTNVGEKGTQLSGGQKQRIAIARALVRKPKILLLDEATSALDTESEKTVQAALDRAREGRTCMVIAHRLSTVENADVIVILHSGQVVESGSHRELMDHRGFYYELQKAQRRSKRIKQANL